MRKDVEICEKAVRKRTALTEQVRITLQSVKEQ